MTKKELKTGMVVEYRAGGKRVVFLGTPLGDVLISDIGYAELDCYKDDLCHKSDEQFDIVAVYEPFYPTALPQLFWNEQERIWRRSDVKEVTLSEIAEKFGIAVEDIRIKEV